MWRALQAHVDFLMRGAYLVGVAGFFAYACHELIMNLAPPVIAIIRNNNRRRAEHLRRHFGAADDGNDVGNDDDAAAGGVGGGGDDGGGGYDAAGNGAGAPVGGAGGRVVGALRWAATLPVALVRRFWRWLTWPWHGMRIPANILRDNAHLPHFAMLVVWFATLFQHSSGGGFTRLVLVSFTPMRPS